MKVHQDSTICLLNYYFNYQLLQYSSPHFIYIYKHIKYSTKALINLYEDVTRQDICSLYPSSIKSEPGSRFGLGSVSSVLILSVAQPVPDLGQMRPCANKVMRPLTWAQKEINPVYLHRQSGNLGIVKILRYIRSDMYTASATNNGVLCLITPKHNGESSTGRSQSIAAGLPLSLLYYTPPALQNIQTQF